ncbi:hypothetical protein BG58_17930 [Caballeronia jiangsuensis]|nr:hypothetical protein BG58_17930 [Caballeronia jiangsuensis]
MSGQQQADDDGLSQRRYEGNRDDARRRARTFSAQAVGVSPTISKFGHGKGDILLQRVRH